MTTTNATTEIETTLRPMAESYTTWEAFIWEDHDGTYAGLASVTDLPFGEDEFEDFIWRERDTTKRPGERIASATQIKPYERPFYLVEEVARITNRSQLAYLNECPWSVRTRLISGWGEANAVVNVGDDGFNLGSDYLVRLEV